MQMSFMGVSFVGHSKVNLLLILWKCYRGCCFCWWNDYGWCLYQIITRFWNCKKRNAL